MKNFGSYLCEGYVNAIGSRGEPLKKKYADAVWAMLQRTYSKIGGIRGSGFASIVDMIANIPFWKLYIKNGKLLAVILYKDSGGRKAVALATDGTKDASDALETMLRGSLNVSYGEYSKSLLLFMIKRIPQTVLEPLLIPFTEVEKVLQKDVASPRDVADSLDSFDARTLRNFPQYKEYFYVRTIGGKPYLKLLIGIPGKNIV